VIPLLWCDVDGNKLPSCLVVSYFRWIEESSKNISTLDKKRNRTRIKIEACNNVTLQRSLLTFERLKEMEAYCVKCKSKKEMKSDKAITMKNGKPATKGVCPTCGTSMFRIGSC